MTAPTPWKLRRHPNGKMTTEIYYDGSPDPIASTAFFGWTHKEMEDHAYLIQCSVNKHHDLLSVAERVIQWAETKAEMNAFERRLVQDAINVVNKDK